ncbi:MAG: thiosulfate oxidation carrier protein SoxY [Gammaproteobacteria bacterium]
MNERFESTPLSRREMMAAVGVIGLLGAGIRLAAAEAKLIDEALAKVLGAKAPQEGRITLDLPEIAENGNTVPLKLSVESPMTADDYVKTVHVFADANPLPEIASFHFTPRSGKAFAATRMRLAKTQNVVAVAQMSDGSLYMASKEVKVTIGGCGG